MTTRKTTITSSPLALGPRSGDRPELADPTVVPSVGVPVSCLIAGTVTGIHTWVLSAVDVSSWPDAAIVLLLAAPMLLALAARTWFTVTHLHWWVAVLGTTLLSLAPPLTMAYGSFWVLFHTVRQARRPRSGRLALADRGWLRPVRCWLTHRLTLGRAFLASSDPADRGSGEVR